ncbi:tRNA threonylcarbamoyladenosine biosynthesis protein TsaE [Roseovarius tolerans]|uniref:tRNA threonylcarbamoyladenosine biosynthesis protein TsaE n=1 Tax=Roseovarius tolerans TaxID=74031 RepID=A0A0L6CSC2_9RHOB|nr:tRNA (adenosine(37)-N6)-threonylcarbamoyltransferase complex ATPase subunit type 1 TsaE [Roseovarius tolerans]KNX40669.1 tRNA threonylcarbamoyladenosine biosynthesis protein TsaE [Roseovarius tolerans]
MSGPRRSLTLASPDATCAFAQALGHRLSAGDVLLLSGGVGAGKTHFARCLIRALLREPEDVPSPTYTLVQTYPGTPCEIWHADLYRLSDPTEVIELGFTEAFETAIALVEWPDRLGDLAPPGALTLDFTPAEAEDTRHLTLTWSDPRWAAKLQGLTDD